ncbi:MULTISPECIES: mechanosensitive ion channel family protein [Infirmifilum]|uniref:mechanosensitive ion channel family protein n=1 Tax=Infirmifilum TaxID=2856573 RepID=UPI00069A0FDE|nr:hypothetical protein [Infirmifilum uzonense]
MPPDIDILQQLTLILNELASSIPKIFLVAIILVAAFIIMKIVNGVIRWLIKIGRFEEILREMVPGGTRLPLTTLSIVLADVAILIAASALILRVYVPVWEPFYRESISYITRAGSVVVLALIAFVMVDALVKSMGLERKTERFFVMISALILVILFVDLAALSSEVKVALTAGLALGVGFLIGIFALWAFFGDYIEELLRALKRFNEGKEGEGSSKEGATP